MYPTVGLNWSSVQRSEEAPPGGNNTNLESNDAANLGPNLQGPRFNVLANLGLNLEATSPGVLLLKIMQRIPWTIPK